MRLKRVAVVYKKSTYQMWVTDRRDRRILRLLKGESRTTKRLVENHELHYRALDFLAFILNRHGIKPSFIYRARPFREEHYDLILTLGGDGTFLEASHRTCRKPILGINSNPQDSVGVFCGYTVETLDRALDEIQSGRLKPAKLGRLSVKLGGKPLPFPVLNDVLVSHASPAGTARYLVRLNGREEEQKSSGVWISSAAGSTAATAAAGGYWIPITSRRYQFCVRELYRDKKRPTKLLRRILKPRETFVLESKMRAGRVFLDGPHASFLFPYGEKLEVNGTAAPLVAFGVGDDRRKQRFER